MEARRQFSCRVGARMMLRMVTPAGAATAKTIAAATASGFCASPAAYRWSRSPGSATGRSQIAAER